MRPTLTICICTSGRPNELARALRSIREGTRQPDQIVVSDDSLGERISLLVRKCCQAYAAEYVQGPCRGLCANRNHVIGAALSEYVSLLDDDAVVGKEFVATALEAIALRPEYIISGDVLESGSILTTPSNPRFLGHFGKRIEGRETIENINLNCNVFPRKVFAHAQFDESITYGYEDTDLCANLLSKGFEIRHQPKLVNAHLPPDASGHTGKRRHLAERARFRVMIRKWGHWQRHVPRLVLFTVIAPCHFFLHNVRHGRFADSLAGWSWVMSDLASLRHLRRPQKRAC